MGSRHGYRSLDGDENPVTVVVGREKREFLVDPFVLKENPFRVLIFEASKKKTGDGRAVSRKKRSDEVVFVDVDEILFEHMLWLMYNDCSSLFKLNIKEVIDFYAQDY